MLHREQTPWLTGWFGEMVTESWVFIISTPNHDFREADSLKQVPSLPDAVRCPCSVSVSPLLAASHTLAQPS